MSHRTVLIAEDDPQWRAVIADILQPQYNIVGFVDRGDAVVSRAVDLQPEVVTLDISMPGISGLNLLPELRRALPDAAIVVLTITRSELYLQEAYSRGANSYVLKPSALKQLLPAIEAARNPRLGDETGNVTGTY